MGYNLSVACLDCEVQCGALRGEEAIVIRKFGSMHSGPGHRKDVMVDNGYAERPWEGEFKDVYDEVMGPVAER